MFEYHYEAYPVLVNIILFLFLLFPFRYAYKGLCLDERYCYYNENWVYRWLGFLTILYCTFGYADNDFFHYEVIYDEIRQYGGTHMEEVYIWLVLHLPDSYLLWRFVVWGGATILTLYTFKRLELEPKVTSCIFVLFYVITLSIMRGNLGVAILFLGYSLWIKPLPKRVWSYVLGAILITVSFFFHRSMFVSILALLATPFKLKKWVVIASLLIFPVLVAYVSDFIQLLIASQEVGDESMLAENLSRGINYAAAESAEFNIKGQIARVLQYFPIVGSLVYVTWKIVFRKIEVPSYIYPLFIYWYVMAYVAFLFFFQETSMWLFVRFMAMAYLPMVIVLSWYYAENRPTLWMKFFLWVALLYCFYRLTATFYTRLNALAGPLTS